MPRILRRIVACRVDCYYATGEEDEQTLAYWNGLPEAPESPEVEPRAANQEVLKEEPKHYARPEGQDGE